MMRRELRETLAVILQTPPDAYAVICGDREHSQIRGKVLFYSIWGGTLVTAEIDGLPTGHPPCGNRVFGFHIHEGSRCRGTLTDPFADTGSHWNPAHCPHPEHAGDLPPLFGSGPYALSIFYTDRFYPEELIGHTIILHDMPDDFRTQPSGDSGRKIACGEIRENKM